MNRTLRRPMFRTGGTAEGITSGLSRQGYAGVDENVARKKCQLDNVSFVVKYQIYKVDFTVLTIQSKPSHSPAKAQSGSTGWFICDYDGRVKSDYCN